MSIASNLIATSMRNHGLLRHWSASQLVVQDVEAAFTKAVEVIREEARDQGLSQSLVEAALVRAGLVEPPTAASPVSAENTSSNLETELADLRRKVDALATAARRHGVSV